MIAKMRFNVKRSIVCCLVLIAVLLCLDPMQACAEESATVTFGSENYTEEAEGEFPIGVYIKGESKIGAYYVELEYDTKRMEYLDGGEEEQDGRIILCGTGTGEEVRYMLHFRAVSGGQAGIRVKSARVQEAEENGGEEFTVTVLGSAPISIGGEDIDGISFFDRLLEEEQAEEDGADEGGKQTEDLFPGIVTDVPLTGMLQTQEHGTLYLVDHEQYVPDQANWKYHLSRETYGDRQVSFLANASGAVKILYFMDEAENFYPYAYSGELYPCYSTVSNGQEYYYMSAYACEEWPEELTLRAIMEEHVFYAMDMDGNGAFYQFTLSGDLVKWDEGTSRESVSRQMTLLTIIFLTAGIAILVICGVAAWSINRQNKRRKKVQLYRLKRMRDREAAGDLEEDWDPEEEPYLGEEYDSEEEYLDGAEESATNSADDRYTEDDLSEQDFRYLDLEMEKLEEREQERSKRIPDLKGKMISLEEELPVISVQDVSMHFRISTSNASGIKEYMIQLIKHQVTFRELVALDHVSFDVFQGEVVGIIGTNGSGKSTLLRIVSGALNPTGGKVLVDRKKVQLLTLGTGFDMELSARENVYLNGSIIGYNKEFLDAHYEEIVEFAELQGFMEEKVKNYSSGMVSRLGFAIATAGDAAEILILDEVLSVGDEFFRKKSLKRIKEMIHGGSTVIMVSHGMGTILDNCTKVVWIEKGVLQMVGEAKTVCKAYQAQKG